MIAGDSIDHLQSFIDRLERKEPFGIIRCNDGEYMILNRTIFQNIDLWQFKGHGRLIDDLSNAICSTRELPNMFVGIPCKDCHQSIYDYYITNFNEYVQTRWTYGNLFCNRNWYAFTNYLTENKVPFYYIGPGKNMEQPLNVLERFFVDEFFVHEYDEKIDQLKSSLQEWVQNRSGIFMFSIGPVTKVLIPFLMKLFPKNTYMDVGSSIDMFMKGYTNRLYYDNNQPYTQVVCDFATGHRNCKEPVHLKPFGEITAILTLFKRPHTMIQQIEAIVNQTVPPKEIFILKNFAEGIDIPKIPEYLQTRVPIHIIDSTKNFGVWGRFAIALLANTEFVCVFDDDTIPGNKWFENCLASMKKREGLYGTIGIIYHTNAYYPHTRYGWDKPNIETVEVDIVGHSWFLKREWLGNLWSFAPDFNSLLKSGEDIGLSCFLQKKGIPTLVPPHPPNDVAMFGSIPQYAINYGTDDVAISMEVSCIEKFEFVFRYFVDLYGFKIKNST